MSDCPRVLALVGDRDVCAWWRLTQPLAELQRRSLPVEWATHGDPASMARAADFDLVILSRLAVSEPHRDEATAWVERLHQRGVALVYEVDDDILSPAADEHLMVSPDHPLVPTVSDRADRLFALRQCDGVTVSTPHLASVVRRFTDAPVQVVPNAVDLEWWKAHRGRRTIRGLTIGWAGGVRPDADLEPMAVAWARIAQRFPDIRFVVQGHQSRAIVAARVPERQIIRLPWLPLEQHPAALRNVDIGCCALADTEFNRSRSPIKAWEYAVSGAAVVASPTVYGSFLRDGIDGMLARTTDEWEDALSLLIRQEPIRKGLAYALRRRVARECSLAACWPNWPAAWSAILASRRQRSRGRWSWVGESGPELVRAGRGGLTAGGLGA